MFDDAGGSGKPRIGQIALSYDPDEPTAVQRAMEQFRSAQMPCGPDVERHIAGIRQFEAAGFTHVALVQVGADTRESYLTWAATRLLPVLRAS